MPTEPPGDPQLGLYRFAFEQAPYPTIVLREDGRVLLQNGAARALPHEVVERLFAGDGRELDLFFRELASKGHSHAEIDVAARAFAIDGCMHGAQLVVTLRDLGVQRVLETELRALKRVESLGQFTAGLAHDFNNLLTPILWLSACLETELPAGGQARELARDTRIAAEKAASLARQTLGLVRREPVRGRAAAVSVNPVVADMRTLIERIVGGQIRVEVALGGDAGLAVLDRERLERALVDLAVNARDAMPEGGRLTVTTKGVSFDQAEASSTEGASAIDYVCLQVTDTGSGMTPEVRARVFERFFTTKAPGRGTGLGLSAVQRFVAESGGCIAVHSQPGRGTTVALYFPSAAPAARAAS
jgi:signal transduction histidine kinase